MLCNNDNNPLECRGENRIVQVETWWYLQRVNVVCFSVEKINSVQFLNYNKILYLKVFATYKGEKKHSLKHVIKRLNITKQLKSILQTCYSLLWFVFIYLVVYVMVNWAWNNAGDPGWTTFVDLFLQNYVYSLFSSQSAIPFIESFMFFFTFLTSLHFCIMYTRAPTVHSSANKINITKGLRWARSIYLLFIV